MMQCTILYSLYVLAHSISPQDLWDEKYYQLHFIGEETEAQSDCNSQFSVGNAVIKKKKLTSKFQ